MYIYICTLSAYNQHKSPNLKHEQQKDNIILNNISSSTGDKSYLLSTVNPNP